MIKIKKGRRFALPRIVTILLLCLIAVLVQGCGKTDEPVLTDKTACLARGNTVIGVHFGSEKGEELTIPLEMHGETIEEIGEFAFAENFGGMATVRKVILPKTVKRIGDNAFQNCTDLEEIVLEEGTLLTHIGQSAFSGCTKLEKFTLPKTVTEFRLNVFEKCQSLANFTVSGENPEFFAKDNVLYSKNADTLLLYPMGLTNRSFIVPETVTEISMRAFENNESLVSVDLNRVTSVREEAFSGCRNLENVIGTKIDFVAAGAFDDTAWFGNQTDSVCLGKTLLIYKGSEESLNAEYFQDIQFIGAKAFYGNEFLENVTLPAELISVGDYAFSGCSSLKSVQILGPERKGIGNDVFTNNAEDRKIYVAQNRLDEYKTADFWEKYAEDICAFYSTVTFDSLGGSACESIRVPYYGQIKLPFPERTGYLFSDWYTSAQDGLPVQNTDYFTELEDSTLYAYWEHISYSINYDLNGFPGVVPSSNPETYYIDSEDIELANPPAVTGYTFNGWMLDGKLIDTVAQGNIPVQGMVLQLKADWDADRYVVHFDLNDSSERPATPMADASVTFGEVYAFAVPVREKYIFDGWYVDDVQYVTSEGFSRFDTWQLFSESGTVTLKARWVPSEITVIVPIP